MNLKNVHKSNCFSDACVYVFEFQIRGLPRCHTLFFLKHNAKFRELDEMDNFVSAELPSINSFQTSLKVNDNNH